MTVTSGLHIQEDKERETMVYVEKTAQKDRDAYQEMRGEKGGFYSKRPRCDIDGVGERK